LLGRNHNISTTEIAPATYEEDQLALEQRLYEESLKVLDEGQVLNGLIVQKDKDELLVDVGGKSEGVLPFRELSLAVDPKALKVGDSLEVMIHRIDDMDGTLFLSERRARALKTWEKVIEAHQNDEVIEATVTQVVKGGVLVDLGMRGFVPASQIRRQPVGNLDELVGQKLRLKDRSRSQASPCRALAAPRARRRAAGQETGVARHARSRSDSGRRRGPSCGLRCIRRSRRHRWPHSQQ
jgi:ribosomal protein S1